MKTNYTTCATWIVGSSSVPPMSEFAWQSSKVGLASRESGAVRKKIR